VLDLAEICASMDEVVSLILRASASRRTTPDRIRAALDRRARMPRRAGLLQALGAAADGVHSLLEFRYSTGLSGHLACPGHAGRIRSAGAGETSTRISAMTTLAW
jgi:hypothetical protein